MTPSCQRSWSNLYAEGRLYEEGLQSKKMRAKERCFRNANRNVERKSCQNQCWIRNHRARMIAMKAEHLHLAAIIILLFFSRNGHKNHDQWLFLFFWTNDKLFSNSVFTKTYNIRKLWEKSGIRNLVLSWEMTPGARDEKSSKEFL